jgi:hypothetical protein
MQSHRKHLLVEESSDDKEVDVSFLKKELLETPRIRAKPYNTQ